MARARLREAATKTEEVLVTPVMAEAWLKTLNTHNRPINVSKVLQFAMDMEAGRWGRTSVPIIFALSGWLMDGQHRLEAVVLSGCAQTFVVVRNEPDEAQAVIDLGSSRTPTDQLHVFDITVSKSVAAAIRVYIEWQRGMLFGDARRARTSTPTIVAWAQANPVKVEALARLESVVRAVPATRSVVMAVALRLQEIDYDDAVSFMRSVASGANLAPGSPRLALSRRLFKARTERTALTTRDIIGMFVVAWNADREGRTMVKIQRPAGGAWTRETFPEPR